MGIFSTKKKHIVDTSVMRVVEDEMVPNAMTRALMEAIFQERGIMPAIMDGALNGNFRNFERMYRYAKKGPENGGYIHGLPDTRVISSSDGFGLALTALRSDLGLYTNEELTVDYMHFRPLNNIHMGWKHLIENLDYDPETNHVKGLGLGNLDRPRYLEKMVAVHRTAVGQEAEASSVGVWGQSTFGGPIPAGPDLFSGSSDLQNMLSTLEVRTGPSELESVEIHVAYYNEVADEVRRIVKTVDLSAYDGDQEFYQAKYHYTSNGQVTEGYWLYDPETGAHTALNDVFTLEYTNPGTYFPVALFRSDDSEMTADSQMGTEAFKTTEKMLKYLNMDYKDIGDSLHENDDIKDIDQAVLMLGVPITGTNELEMEYLFEFFDNHLAKMPAGSAPAYSTGVSRLNATPDTSYAIDISDADFRITLSFDSITKKLGLGEGKIGDHGNVVEEVANDIVGVDMSFVAPTNARLIRRWVTETMYEEIRVVNPKLRYHIYKSKGAESSLDDERLLIPLDYEVVRKINLLHREELYFRSMHFVFNSHVVQKTKWYQSGIFQAVMIVVAVVITVMTYGQGWQSLAAALAAGGAAAAAAAWTILQGILWYVFKAMVFQFVLQELVQIIGIEVAFYLAIAAAMYGGLKLYQNDMVLNATAQNLLGGAMGLTSAAQTELKSMFEDYQSEVEEFNLMQEGKFEELEEVNRELDSGIDLNPFTFIGKEPMLLFGEDPDEYYARTIHSGNVGLESMNIVQNFVGISLRLPTMQETTGDTFT